MTAKEDAQKARLEANADAQRLQDAHGYAVASGTPIDKVKESEDLAKKTRELHAEQVGRDQARQTDNETVTDDDSVVSTAAKGEGKKDYAEKNIVQKDIAKVGEAPEKRAYDALKKE